MGLTGEKGGVTSHPASQLNLKRSNAKEEEEEEEDDWVY